MIHNPIAVLDKFSQEVIDILGLPIMPDTPIMLGKDNVEHMLSEHPIEYIKYGIYMRDIVARPDYVGINKKSNSIEFVKEFNHEGVKGEPVKLAVRATKQGNYFARSIYVLTASRFNNGVNTGTLFPLTKTSV